MNRIIAIGDIHGQYAKLHDLIDKIQLDEGDQVIFLGDYVDRGPDSNKVIDFLIQFKKRMPQTVLLRGNHDQMVLDAYVESSGFDQKRLRDISTTYELNSYASDVRCAYLNGGYHLLNSYGIESYRDIPLAHIDFIRNTVFFHMSGQYLYVHASYDETQDPNNQDPYVLLWARNQPPGSKWIHVVGHQPMLSQKPLFENGRIWLDTGAGYGKALTACNVTTRQFWQVE